VMLRGRMGGDGRAFNLGEATVTRAAVVLADGRTGFAYQLGRDRIKARAAAIIDALWQGEERAAVENALAPVRARLADSAAEPAKAGFAFAVDMSGLPPLSAFARGTDDYPDPSTTLVLAVEALGRGRTASLTGPGIKDTASLALAPLTEDFIAGLADNHARFP